GSASEVAGGARRMSSPSFAEGSNSEAHSEHPLGLTTARPEVGCRSHARMMGLAAMLSCLALLRTCRLAQTPPRVRAERSSGRGRCRCGVGEQKYRIRVCGSA